VKWDEETIRWFSHSKTDFPRHGKAMRWEAGIIKLTAKLA
jgi:hypothetical protein